MHSVTTESAACSAIVVATGEIDAFVAPDLTAALDGAANEARLLVDLASVSFMDSTALGLLVRVARRRGEDGAAFRVVLPSGNARRIFEMTGLDRALPIAADRDEALWQLAAG